MEILQQTIAQPLASLPVASNLRRTHDPSISQPVVAECEIGALFEDQQTISLAETNRLAKMLSRIDNKYVLNLEQFRSLLSSVQHEYAVLEIDGLNQFSYASCYYDDQSACYFEHHQARRQRFKVRTREYLDSGLKFFEIKLKGRRGLTNKHRIDCARLVSPTVDGERLAMLTRIYAQQYKKPMALDLRPALIVRYKRCTLVALQGGERVTIDYSINFGLPGSLDDSVQIGSDFIIVETKSKDGKGIADQALRQLQIRKASKCSKYCIGLNLTGVVSKNNNFLATIKHVRRNIVANQTPAYAGASA